MRLNLLSAMLACAALAGDASAQYPVRTIRIIVGSSGGAPEVVARMVGQRFSETMGQPVVVENRASSNGVTATEATARAAPDGYTLMLAPDGMVAINPHLYPGMSLNPLKELTAAAGVFRTYFILAVNPLLPVKTLPEFVEYARRAKPSISYGSGGMGSQHQLIMEILKSRAAIDLLHVPYKGGTQATTAAVSGEVAALFSGPSVLGQVKSGKLRVLVVSGEKRMSAFPALPALGEYYPGAGIVPWAALYAPAATPRPIITRLNTEMNRWLAEPAIVETLTGMFSEPFPLSVEQVNALLEEQHALYGKLIKALGTTLD